MEIEYVIIFPCTYNHCFLKTVEYEYKKQKGNGERNERGKSFHSLNKL